MKLKDFIEKLRSIQDCDDYEVVIGLDDRDVEEIEVDHGLKWIYFF